MMSEASNGALPASFSATLKKVITVVLESEISFAPRRQVVV